MTESLADFFDTTDGDVPAVSATYTPTVGSVATIAGRFDKPWADGENYGVVMATRSEPQFLCAEAGLPATAAQGDKLTVASVDYRVREIRPDGTGLAMLPLEAWS